MNGNAGLIFVTMLLWTVECFVLWYLSPQPRKFGLAALLGVVAVATVLLGLTASMAD